ncbi:hypothetical protein LSUB1_G008273 [Lachnellula subtilissima]|uniref:2EXR domain-containing protein n=1 Tax=Lachnellula subtilissima TaxID=602034 RepID=A0A8H8U6E3_9HELO|nr:hypothetical protein LSUB1_G008273 [Lachnellula subtilissima]
MDKMDKMNKTDKKSSVDKDPHRFSFPQFPKLPTELRTIIWNLTLPSRIVEIKFVETRGFYTRVKIPVALRVCKDSRDAVLSSYSTCFGNLMFTPRTLFNFSLDTLYIGRQFQEQVLHLVASLNATEISKIQNLAIDSRINFDPATGYDAEIDYDACVKKSSLIDAKSKVFDLMHWLEYDIDEGTGTMKLYHEWPTAVEDMHECPMPRLRVRIQCSCGAFHGDGDEDGDEDDYEDSYGLEYYYDDDDEDVYCIQHNLPAAR